MQIAEFVLAALVSGLIGYATSHYFARRGERELKSEVDQLKRENKATQQSVGLLAVMVGHDGKLTPKRDDDGKLVGVALEGVGSSTLSGVLAAGVGRNGEPPVPITLMPHPDAPEVG
jgi:hypothetical protein